MRFRAMTTKLLIWLAALAFTTLGMGVAITPPAPVLSAEVNPLDKCDRMVQRDAVQVATTGVPLPPGWTMIVDCHAGTEGWVGLADFGTRTITRHLGGERWAGDRRWNYLHEVGHAYDWERLTDEERAAWKVERGLTPDHWYPKTTEQAASDWSMTPAEDWAESFATCHVGPPRWEWRLDETALPTAAQCELLLSIAELDKDPAIA